MTSYTLGSWDMINANSMKKAKQQPTGRESAFSHFSTIPAPSSPRRSGHAYSHQAPPPSASQNFAQQGQAIALPPPLLAPTFNFDEMQFFPRVKAALDSRETYHEFLKLVNLFSQDFIDRARLVHECRSFLGEGELMAQFKEILGWDEAMERSVLKEREERYQPPGRPLTILDRPSREELNIRYGSYRRLPADVRPCHFASLQSHIVKGCAGNQCGMQWPRRDVQVGVER